MPRVSKDTLEKLQAFIDSLPDEARNKCALCNETLTHIVKQAEVETGAGTATVTRELADKINETAAPGDQLSDSQLRGRVRRQEEEFIWPNQPNNQQPEEKAPDEPELKGRHKAAERTGPEKSHAGPYVGDESEVTYTLEFGYLEGTERFCATFGEFYLEVQNAKIDDWSKTKKETAAKCVKMLSDLINY